MLSQIGKIPKYGLFPQFSLRHAILLAAIFEKKCAGFIRPTQEHQRVGAAGVQPYRPRRQSNGLIRRLQRVREVSRENYSASQAE